MPRLDPNIFRAEGGSGTPRQSSKGRAPVAPAARKNHQKKPTHFNKFKPQTTGVHKRFDVPLTRPKPNRPDFRKSHPPVRKQPNAFKHKKAWR
mmetsp:Transcript_17110/g.40824  ORF Transcript_17110/g.40824 Transcript_17110/m.40824 type:complete len:93 (+) Transcript_17110:694-972(+)